MTQTPYPDAPLDAAKPEVAVPTMDAVAVARLAHWPHVKSPWLHEEIGARMLSRLDCIRAEPQSWLSWEPLRSGIKAHAAVAAKYPNAKMCWHSVHNLAVHLEQTRANHPLLQGLSRWLAPSMKPIEQGEQVDMLWVNMALHTMHQPQTQIKKWASMLKPNGFAMLSCLGPDSLMELRQTYVKLGHAPPMHALTDMHDWGDMLIQNGFQEPVMDMERLTLTYSNWDALQADLRDMGRNLHAQRATTTRGRAWHRQWQQQLQTHWPRNADGLLCLTLEVVYGHAWRAAPQLPVEPVSRFSLAAMREMLRKAPK
jgi:malonyl-CoA O-methyltransferase